MTALRWICAIAFAASLPSFAGAQNTNVAKWGQVGGWEIRVDRTLGDGCFAFQVFERGTVVRIGFDVANQKIYLVFGHDNWKSLEEGKVYPVRIVFDGGKGYNGEMRGMRIGGKGIVFLAHRNLSTDFVKDFMERNGMEVFYRGERIANLSLKNTYAAVGEVANCQRELGFASRSPGTRAPQDPFASSSGRQGGSDPFK